MMVCAIVLAGLSAFGVSDDGPHDVLWGARNSADAKVCYRVVDPDGSPVVDAEADVWYRTDYPKLKEWNEQLKTDTNGCFVAEGNLNHRITVCVDKDGWYKAFDGVELRKTKSEPAIIDGKWQPYGEVRTIVLKPYKNPIEMTGMFERRDIKVPCFGKWLAFDIEKMDWLTPNGDGVNADVLMRFTYEARNRYWDFNATMELSFTNNPCGGAYKMKKDGSSEFKSVYAADVGAEYQMVESFSFDGRILESEGQHQLEDDSYLVFRTRTKVDSSGKLISAHYGKIYGRIEFAEIVVFRGVFFNPTPNDTNLEDEETHRRSVKRRKHERELRERGK